jgi:bifunctional NMN adenylyltransferase/nudix hydrolase
VNNSNDPIVITGSKRDDTTFYLDMFPAPMYEMDLVEENRQVSKSLSATWCRELYLGRTLNDKTLSFNEYDALMRAFVPPSTMDYLREFEKTDHYAYLAEAYRIIKERQEELKWKYGKHSSITIDNVVVQSGYVLLIKRKSHPGKDLWALPGGYLEEDEWTFEGALRELGEETKIDVPPRVLRNSLVFDGWFEAPDRSLINRVVTHAFYFKLPDYKIDGRVTLPKVKGSDDAKKARWFPISEALEMSEVLFDDHFDILEDFLNRPNARDQL